MESIDFSDADLNVLALKSCKCSIYGAFAAVIEGHKGLKCYDKGKIVFSSKNNNICVLGSNLSIKQLAKNYALIVGEISGVTYETVG